MAARFTYYRQLFTVQLTHNAIPGIASEYFALEPTAKTKQLLLDKKMRFKTEPGKITVYYGGTADPSNVPPVTDDKIVPYSSVDNNTEFMFSIKVADANILVETAIPSPETTPAFDLKKTNTAIPWYYIKQTVFNETFSADASTNVFETFTIKDVNDKIVLNGTTKKNNQEEFPCSIDLSLQDSGFYSIELGSEKKQFYLDSIAELSDKYGFIRVIKDNTWTLPTGIYDPVKYNVFTYEFQSASYAITI